MNDFFSAATFAAVFITIGSYLIGCRLKKRFHTALANPILIAVIITIAVLLIFDIDYEVYEEGAKYVSFLLTPATVCLAIPLYEQFELLKKNLAAVLIGVISGVLTSMVSVLLLVLLFNLDHRDYVTFLPKSITTAIGMVLSENMGGYVSLSVAVIILTGIIGNVFAESILKLCHITEPIAKGLSIGSASHAIGTTKAMELGEVEGAMSSLSIVLSGVLTVFGVMVFENLV